MITIHPSMCFTKDSSCPYDYLNVPRKKIDRSYRDTTSPCRLALRADGCNPDPLFSGQDASSTVAGSTKAAPEWCNPLPHSSNPHQPAASSGSGFGDRHTVATTPVAAQARFCRSSPGADTSADANTNGAGSGSAGHNIAWYVTLRVLSR